MATVDRPLTPQRDTASRLVRPPKPFFLRSWFGLAFAVVLVGAHVIGWQVSQINPALLAEKSPRVAEFFFRVMQPDIIASDQKQLQASVPIVGVETPPEAAQPAQSEVMEVTPLIKRGNSTRPEEPTAAQDERFNVQVSLSSNQVAPAQEISVSGSGLRPNTAGRVIWQTVGTNAASIDIGGFATDAQGNFSTQVQVPADLDRVVGSYGFPNNLVVTQNWGFGGIYLSPTVGEVARLIVETVFLALMGTTFAVLISIPLSFLASHNLMSHSIVTLAIYGVARTILNILRSIEVLILAVIFAATVGLGPFAGVLALTLHSIASLGKLYSEAIESIDPGPIEAITATGANRFQVITYAVVPQFIPQFISFTLYRWDINVRMSTVIGFVGGGGIGFILKQYMDLGFWSQAATAIWAIAIVVILMDWASSRVRAAVI